MQQLRDVIARLRGLEVRSRPQIPAVVQRIVERIGPRAASQQIDELVAGNGVYPRGQRLPGVVRVTLIVDRQKWLPHEILDFLFLEEQLGSTAHRR